MLTKINTRLLSHVLQPCTHILGVSAGTYRGWQEHNYLHRLNDKHDEEICEKYLSNYVKSKRFVQIKLTVVEDLINYCVYYCTNGEEGGVGAWRRVIS